MREECHRVIYLERRWRVLSESKSKASNARGPIRRCRGGERTLPYTDDKKLGERVRALSPLPSLARMYVNKPLCVNRQRNNSCSNRSYRRQRGERDTCTFSLVNAWRKTFFSLSVAMPF